jgi:hypothetical protein
MTRHSLPLKLVLIIVYLLYFRLLLFIDTDSYLQLPEVINSLIRFENQQNGKLYSLGINLQLVQSLMMGYEGLRVFGDKFIQTRVDTVILTLLPTLFSYEIIDTFDLENISKLPLFGFEKIEKNSVCHYLLPKLNGLIGHCDYSLGVLDRE